MHLFPQLRKIEQKYGDRLVVVGVHSPKFPAERETANLREAVLRYRIEHPVVNDRDFKLWQAFEGRAWPTLVFIDPQGRVIGKHEGELPFSEFDPLVDGMLAEFQARGLLRPGQAPLPIEGPSEADHPLRFPGRALSAGGRLFVADSNHHRIVIARWDGGIEKTIGAGVPALRDGPPHQAAFQQPQGLALDGETLYVADTENHAIRSVNLADGMVTTLAGTGEQAPFGSQVGGAGPMSLSSPWDLVKAGSRLYVAMAGSHQICSLDLESGRVEAFAGSGREDLQDGSRDQAWFAQPSGLALLDNTLYVADSEVSAVRAIDLETGEVSTLVGEGLFVFGDEDGDRRSARLQHPLGIAAHEGTLYVADSYNNKVKRLDPRIGRLSTWLGSGASGMGDGAGAAAAFREPGGVSAAAEGLIVADTNNHRIAIADWSSGEVRTLIGR